MAQGQPRGGCFKCGNPHHSAWECHQDLSHDEEKINRRVNQEHHVLLNPDVKKSLNQKSHQLHMQRFSAKVNADSVAWESIVAEIQRLLPQFRSWETRLSAARRQRFALTEQASHDNFQLILGIQNEVRSELESVRIVSATAKQKINNARANLGRRGYGTSHISVEDISGIYGRLQELTGMRDAVWELSVTSLKAAKNVSESISDLMNLRSTISQWCSAMFQWLLTNPPAVDHPRLDTQISQQRADFLQMQERANYITERVPLEAEVKQVVESVRRQLEQVDLRRAEFRRSYCFNCGVRQAEITCRCSYPFCRRCYAQSPSCPSCELKHMFAE